MPFIPNELRSAITKLLDTYKLAELDREDTTHDAFYGTMLTRNELKSLIDALKTKGLI